MAKLHPWHLLTALRVPWGLLDAHTQKHHRMLDRIFSLLTHHDRFFPHGWGDPGVITQFGDDLQRMADSVAAGEAWVPRPCDVRVGAPTARRRAAYVTQDGSFASPLAESGLLPPESAAAHFRFVGPEPLGAGGQDVPVVLLLPGTGEHGYSRRMHAVAIPLAQRGVASVILEGPFYGKRRPAGQRGSKLGRVSDLPVLGRATIEEAQALLRWLRETHGYRTMAVGGGSMGGLHSAMTASLTPFPLGVASWLGPPSAAPVFTEGVLADCCEWDRLSQTEAVAAHLDEVPASELFDKLEDAWESSDAVERAKAAMSRLLGITDITHFPAPTRPDAAAFVVAEYDEYIPPALQDRSWPLLQQRWPGAEVRRLPAAHVSGILFGTHQFQELIEEVLQRVASPPPPLPPAPSSAP